MSSDKMDQYFKENLQAHETPMNTDALWESIAPIVVEEKKSRKWFVIWLWGTGLLLLGFGIWGAISWSYGSFESESVAVRVNENKAEEIEICDEIDVLNDVQVYDNQLIEKALIEENKTRTNHTKNKIIAKNKTNANPIESTNPKTINTHNMPQVLMANKQDEEVEIRHKINHKNSTNNVVESAENFTQLEISFEGKITIAQANLMGDTTVHSNEKSEFTSTSKSDENTLLTENLRKTFPFLTTIKTLLFIPERVVELPFLPFEMDEIKKVETKEGKKNPKPKKKRKPFAISLYATPSLSIKSLTVKMDTMPVVLKNKALMERREASEKSLETFNVGLTFNWQHSSGFYIGTGLQYAQMTEKFTYFKQTSWIEHASFATDSIFKRTINKEIYNRFKMIDIPLFVGYEFGKKKWKYSMEAGALFNLSLVSSGQIFGQEEDTFDKYDETQNTIYKKNIGISFTGNVGISRMLNDKWSIGAQAGFQYIPKSFTQKDYGLQQKYLNIGLKIKCAYRW